jgi:hypothetical protein
LHFGDEVQIGMRLELFCFYFRIREQIFIRRDSKQALVAARASHTNKTFCNNGAPAREDADADIRREAIL